MKKVFSILLLTGFTLFLNLNSSGQALLHIVSIDNFPQTPGDTAYEGLVYHNIRIHVTNTGSNNFFGDIHVFLYSQNLGITAQDTLRDDQFHTNYLLLANGADTVSLSANPNYRFKITHYAAGDNIIVVWPFSGPSNFDTYHTTVFYYPLSTEVSETGQSVLNLYPNPASQVIHLNYIDEKSVGRVRIYDLVGREVFNTNEAVKTINVSSFDKGVYFLERSDKNGKRTINKILITTD